jgi:hypothetical protein
MTTEGAREPILERRERIVEDIGDSLEHLSRILGEIQGYGAVEENKNSEMARIRAEMEECLVVANRVEERMKSWEGPREVETSR